MYVYKVNCPKCGKELDGVQIAYGHSWECSDCHEDKEEPIHCERGCKVEFAFPDNGREHEKEEAKILLTEGAVYEVESVQVGGWCTDIELKEFLGKKFNSVFFRRVPLQDVR